MDQSDDDTILGLTLGLGFQDHLITNTSTTPADHQNIMPPPSPPTLDHHHRQHNPSFSFLTLALSEPKTRSDYDDHHHNHTTDDHDVRRDKGGDDDDDDIIITKEDLNKGKTVVAAVASSLTAVISDEEDYCSTPPKKKLRLSKHQISILENTFQLHPTLNPKDKNDLATQLNLRPRQVEVWFQNRRARIKMKQTEVDRESLKKCCEILREENRRLQQEVMELKSLKQIAMPPFQFQLPPPSPATPTLTAMCPSCEGTGRSSSSNSLNPNNGGGDGSPTRSFFSSSTDSNNTPKNRLCK